MDFERVVLSVFGVIVGFILSQSINVIRYIRRPKLIVNEYDGCTLSFYKGDHTEADSEIEFGFYIVNNGKTIAENVRVLITNIECKRVSANIQSILDHIIEIKCPVNFIPPTETVMVCLGKSTTSEPSLMLSPKDRRIHDE